MFVAGWSQDIALDKDELERETARAKQRYLEQRPKAPTVDIAIDVLNHSDKKELNNEEISLSPLKHRSTFRRHRRNRHKKRQHRQRRGRRHRRWVTYALILFYSPCFKESLDCIHK